MTCNFSPYLLHFIEINIQGKTFMESENPFNEGLRELSSGRTGEALFFFKKAAADNKTPLICSYLAYCRAKIEGVYREAVDICMDARKADPKNSDIYLNLGRIHLLAGNRKMAIHTFRLGLRYERNSRIINELKALGQRKAPPFPFLNRSNLINKYLGKLMTKFSLR
jgi:tetratricopeptide (TPR) repeat protein